MEGEYRFYLFAAWASFLAIFYILLTPKTAQPAQPLNNKSISKLTNKSAAKSVNNSYKSVLFALILSALFIVSSIFSEHLPLTLEKLPFYLIALAVFIFFRLLPKNNFKPKLFFYDLAICTLTLNLFVLFFTFIDPQQDLFPAMNLLIRSQGHNHYVAFLLLVIPVFWWQFLFSQEENWPNKKEMKILSIILLFSSYLIVIISLARIALLITLLQLVIIFLLNKKVFFSVKQNRLSKFLMKVFIFAFSSIAMVFLFLSIPFGQAGESLCPLIFEKKELCKPILKNDRFAYWQKAWAIFREHPYFGSGLKTFNFASRQFPSVDYQVTAYAHNIFLHNLAEGGLFAGGWFIFFICYLFYQSFLLVKKNKNPLDRFLLIATLSSLANALFDFDWHFFVIFTLTLIFLAVILRDADVIKKPNHYYFNFKNYFLILVIFTVFFALADQSVRILTKQNRFDSITKYFPYLDLQIRSLLNEKKLNEANFTNLYDFYRHDPEFLHQFSLLDTMDKTKKVSLQIEWASLDPLSFVKDVNFQELDFQTAAPLADTFVNVAQKNQFLNNLKVLDYWEQRNIAAQFFNFANQAYQQGDMRLAVNFYQQALLLNEFVMSDREAVFLNDTNLAQISIFLQLFKDFNPEKMGPQFYQYMNLYETTLIYLFQNNQMEDFFILAEAMFKQQYNFSWFLFRDLLAISQSPADKQRLEQVHEHFKEMTTWSDFWPIKTF